MTVLTIGSALGVGAVSGVMQVDSRVPLGLTFSAAALIVLVSGIASWKWMSELSSQGAEKPLSDICPTP